MIAMSARARELAGTEEEEIETEDGGSIATLIEIISRKYCEEAYEYLHDNTTGNIDPSIKFLINGVDTRRLQGFKTRLKDKEVVAIIPPIGGG